MPLYYGTVPYSALYSIVKNPAPPHLQAVPLYLSEIAPARARGALNITFQMATTLGILGGELVDYATQSLGAWGWRLCLALAGVPALVLLLGSLLLPETPNSLLERGHCERGREVLQRLRGKDVNVSVREHYPPLSSLLALMVMVLAGCVFLYRECHESIRRR